MIQIEKTASIRHTGFFNRVSFVGTSIFDDMNNRWERNCKVYSGGTKAVLETRELAWRYAWRLVTGVKPVNRLDAMHARVNNR